MNFSDSHVRSVRHESETSPPDAAKCLEVVRVGRISPASRAGVTVKHLLVSVDGSPAAPQAEALPFERRQDYVFYSRDLCQTTRMTTDGIEIGVALKLAPEAVKATYSPAKSDPEMLEILWEAGDWAGLERLAASTVKIRRDYPPLVFLGAAAFEQGRKAEGLDMIQEYLQNYARGWTTNFTAVGYYYTGQALLESNQIKDGLKKLQDAFQFHPFDRVAKAIESISGTRPAEAKNWLGQVLPAYELAALDVGGGRASAVATLRSLKAHQRLVVCSLASYRGNGPYNLFMRRYLKYSAGFGEYLPQVHVITTNPERRPDRPHWYEAEDKARSAGVPMRILWDQSGRFTEGLRAHGSPQILVVDRRGKVLFEGSDLEEPELWDAIA